MGVVVVIYDVADEGLCILVSRGDHIQNMTYPIRGDIEQFDIAFTLVKPQDIGKGIDIGIPELLYSGIYQLIFLLSLGKHGIGHGNLSLHLNHRSSGNDISKPLAFWAHGNGTDAKRTIEEEGIAVDEPENPADQVVADMGRAAIQTHDFDAHGHLTQTSAIHQPLTEEMVQQNRSRQANHAEVSILVIEKEVRQGEGDQDIPDDHEEIDYPGDNAFKNGCQLVLDVDVLRCGYFDLCHGCKTKFL